MKIETETGSVYEICPDENKIRFLCKSEESGTVRITEEWKTFESIVSLEVGKRPYIVWGEQEIDGEFRVTGTCLSKILSIT